MCKFIGKSNEWVFCKLSKSEILRLYSIVHVAMETTKMSNFTCQWKSFISIFFTCEVSACELQPFSCHDLANDIYSQTAKTVFSHLKRFIDINSRKNSMIYTQSAHSISSTTPNDYTVPRLLHKVQFSDHVTSFPATMTQYFSNTSERSGRAWASAERPTPFTLVVKNPPRFLFSYAHSTISIRENIGSVNRP